MKLKEYNKLNSGRAMNGKPTIRLHKSGIFTISKTANESINLKYGDAVIIHQDADRPKDWYIEKTSTDDGFVIRGKNNGAQEQSIIFASAGVRSRILKSIGIPQDENITCLLGVKQVIEGREMWPIITKMAEDNYKQNGNQN